MEKLFEDYNDLSGTKVSSVDYMIQDFVSRVCNAIDEQLHELKEDVAAGTYSNKEIAEKIQELRNKIY